MWLAAETKRTWRLGSSECREECHAQVKPGIPTHFWACYWAGSQGPQVSPYISWLILRQPNC
eukprot:12088371-Prorocentrum_lima.AAC.1